ncbi:2OG-Fe(II) oxygenase [Alteromonas sp. SM 2104]|nr:2OG-Fe(II) oxygenase [Alteromonas oceanisediminis]
MDRFDSPPDFIEVIDDALPAELCDDIIAAFDSSPNKTPGHTGGGVDTERKKSTDVSFSQQSEFAPLFQRVMQSTGEHLLKYVEKYHFALIGPLGLTVAHPDTQQPIRLTDANFEEVGKPSLRNLVNYLFRIGEVNAQHYAANDGGYPYWHSEVYPQAPHNEALHRTMLFMFYLNDVSEGGTTDFVYQNRSIQPKKGRMVIAPAYFTHTHRGSMPISNDKYILTSWVLFNRAEQIYTPPKQ